MTENIASGEALRQRNKNIEVWFTDNVICTSSDQYLHRHIISLVSHDHHWA